MHDRLKTVFGPMRPSALRPLALLLALAGLTPLVTMTGCSDQGEGERCTYFSANDAGVNGSSECAAGLVCRPPSTVYFSATSLPGPGSLGVCCPPAGNASSAAACNATSGGSTTVGPATGDGSFDVITSDAGVDAATADATLSDAALSDAPLSEASSTPDTGTADSTSEAASDAGVDSPSDAPQDVTTGG